MNSQLHRLARRYAATLRKYLKHEQEAVLEQAYELGRTAIAQKLGVLEMARIHCMALRQLLQSPVFQKDCRRVLSAAEIFLLESFSPFEATHRGFGELNVSLQKRNRELEAEITERKRAEDALRRSEQHYQRLFNEAQAMQENLRDLSNKILYTQEEERRRISRELHDEVGQSLTAISVTLATLKNNGATAKLAGAQRLLRETMETVHDFARELRPALLDELGLLPALRSYLKAFAGRTGMRVHFHGNPVAEKLANQKKTVLFRIAQECLTNVCKHARASQVAVAIRKFQNGVCMEITDDGRSFKTGAATSARSRGRLGLLGMQERVRLVNGQFAIKPQPGKGTTVRVVIPFETARTARFRPRALIQRHDQNGSPRPRPQLLNRKLQSHLGDSYGKNQSSARR
jgi:signal transduction histidine kinase